MKQLGPKKTNLVRRTSPEQIQLLEIAAHDLCNPVNGILAASQYLLEDAAPLLEEQHVTLLRSIESASWLVLKLIEDMLEIPVTETGKPRMHFQVTDLASLVNQSATTYQPLAESRNVVMDVVTDGLARDLDLDRPKMSQAINAVFSNAIKCSQPGGRIKIHMTTRPADVALTVRVEEPGTSAEDLKALFDPLCKRSTYRGLTEIRTALMLAKVRRIIEGHHGDLRVEGDTLRGSTLTLRLPRHVHATPRKRPESEHPQHANKKTMRAT